jgi:hypothetical protein
MGAEPRARNRVSRAFSDVARGTLFLLRLCSPEPLCSACIVQRPKQVFLRETLENTRNSPLRVYCTLRYLPV